MEKMQADVVAGTNEVTDHSVQVSVRITLSYQLEVLTPDGRSVVPPGRKTRALLVILALSTPRPVMRARLAGMLWSRRTEEKARASLSQEIHRLVNALQPAGSDILTVTREQVALRLGCVEIDVDSLLLATPADLSGLDRLKGKLLDEFDGLDPAFDGWLAAERERLQDRACVETDRLMRYPLEPEATIPIAQRLLGVGQTYDQAWRALMSASADRKTEVQAYEQSRTALKENSDTPSKRTQLLLADIRAVSGRAVARSEPMPPEPPAAQRDGARIGVLPLQMLGTEPAEAYLSVSLANKIAAAFAAFHAIYQVSPESLRSQGNKDGRRLKRDFQLNYLINGSVQRSGDRLRVNVRLLDLEDGECLAGAYRFDGSSSNLLSLQDQVTAEATGQLYTQIIRLECLHAVARPLATANVYDLVLRAMLLMVCLDRKDIDEAGNLLNRALAAEPSNAWANAWRAYWLTLMASQGWVQNLESARREVSSRIERAVALDFGDARCLAIGGIVRSVLYQQPHKALDLHKRALKINPNLPIAVGLMGVTLTYLGDVGGALRQFAAYDRLAPQGPSSFFVDAAQTLLELLRGDDAAAVHAGRRLTELHPNLVPGFQHYLCALGHAGEHKAAEIALSRLLTLHPDCCIERCIAMCPLQHPAHLAYYVTGLRLAGVPEEGHVSAGTNASNSRCV